MTPTKQSMLRPALSISDQVFAGHVLHVSLNSVVSLLKVSAELEVTSCAWSWYSRSEITELTAATYVRSMTSNDEFLIELIGWLLKYL